MYILRVQFPPTPLSMVSFVISKICGCQGGALVNRRFALDDLTWRLKTLIGGLLLGHLTAP
jgi:hypothetical protein